MIPKPKFKRTTMPRVKPRPDIRHMRVSTGGGSHGRK